MLTATNDAGKYMRVRNVIHRIASVSFAAFSVKSLIIRLSSRVKRANLSTAALLF